MRIRNSGRGNLVNDSTPSQPALKMQDSAATYLTLSTEILQACIDSVGLLSKCIITSVASNIFILLR